MMNISDFPASSSAIATTRSKCQKTLHDTVCTEQCELPTGKLSVQKNVVCCMLYLLRPDQAGKAMCTINKATVNQTHWLNTGISAMCTELERDI